MKKSQGAVFMSDVLMICFTSLLTIFGGVVLLVVGQFVTHLFVEPFLEQRRLIGEIIHVLDYYRNVYTDPLEKGESDRLTERRFEARRMLREKSTLLHARTFAIPFYDDLARVGLVRPWECVKEASRMLVGLSNLCYDGDRDASVERREAIERALFPKLREKRKEQHGK